MHQLLKLKLFFSCWTVSPIVSMAAIRQAPCRLESASLWSPNVALTAPQRRWMVPFLSHSQRSKRNGSGVLVTTFKTHFASPRARGRVFVFLGYKNVILFRKLKTAPKHFFNKRCKEVKANFNSWYYAAVIFKTFYDGPNWTIVLAFVFTILTISRTKSAS